MQFIFWQLESTYANEANYFTFQKFSLNCEMHQIDSSLAIAMTSKFAYIGIWYSFLGYML